MAENTKDTGENLPLDERVVHKNWKTRMGAYEELERIFKELGDADPKFEPYRNIHALITELQRGNLERRYF